MFFVAPWEKNRLAELANSELRMSVWTDDVYSFMRSQKRRRIQSSDISQDFDAMR
jgi:ubiquitin carboxyl-terminal hydrolase 36/42